MPETDIIFFDIGGTLADVELPALNLLPRPHVLYTLQRLRLAGCRIGIISDNGTIDPGAIKNALTVCGLMEHLTPELIFFGRKTSPVIFADAVRNCGRQHCANSCAFVGEDPAERDFALKAGLAALSPGVIIA
jgi:FMN phosphatase YigB (HAD superfamily)